MATIFSIHSIILFILCLVLLLVTIFKSSPKKIEEGFENQQSSFVYKDSSNLYDEFYASIYDYVMNCPERQSFELMTLYKETNPDKHSTILDIGCGTGYQVHTFHNTLQCKVYGLDKSNAMTEKCKANYPDVSASFITGDAQSKDLFYGSTFTHILCLHFTIYEIQNKTMFFTNAIRWLKNGGYMVLHLVNINEIQSMNKNKIDFNEFQYTSAFTNPNVFQEEFSFTSGQKRKQENKLYIEQEEYILTLARRVGFVVRNKIYMNVCNCNHQFLYILQKPLL